MQLVINDVPNSVGEIINNNPEARLLAVRALKDIASQFDSPRKTHVKTGKQKALESLKSFTPIQSKNPRTTTEIIREGRENPDT